MRGAEPFSAPGGPNGALVVHGFTGTPQSMRGLAEAFAAAGYAVELPRLPGHGTSVDDMATTTFADWSAAVEQAYDELAGRCERVVVSGLSMGATLAAWLTVRHPEIAGLIVINGGFAPPEPNLPEGIEQLVHAGLTRIPGPGNDIADPDQTELAYSEMPPPKLSRCSTSWSSCKASFRRSAAHHSSSPATTITSCHRRRAISTPNTSAARSNDSASRVASTSRRSTTSAPTSRPRRLRSRNGRATGS